LCFSFLYYLLFACCVLFTCTFPFPFLLDHHHKLVLSLRAESTLKITLLFNSKLFSKSHFHSVDSHKKANYHPQWRHIKGQGHQHYWMHGPPTFYQSAANHRRH